MRIKSNATAFNSTPPNAAYMRQWIGSALVKVMACRLFELGSQAIIETNAGLLSIGPLGTNFSEILIKIQNFSFMKMWSENIVFVSRAFLF